MPAMKLRFTKMQGAGNDFVMLDGIRQQLDLSPATVRRLADRRFGIGADQVLVVEASPEVGADFRYRIFNADGGEVEQCGNGARCFVKFVHQQGLSRRPVIRVITAGGLIEPRLEDDGSVSVDMGPPDFHPDAAGFNPAGLVPRQVGGAQLWPLVMGGHEAAVVVVSMGNPHAVQFVADVDAAPVATLGPLLENDPRFAQGVNAGFVQIIDRSTVRLRVWERGTGETLACGTGACAAAVAGMRMGLLDAAVRVQARGGELRIEWQDRAGAAGRAPADGQPLATSDSVAEPHWGRRASDTAAVAPVRMRGPAETVFEGEIELP
jgi:diaminopimelate epimerase